jgi:hypothetical protein
MKTLVGTPDPEPTPVQTTMTVTTSNANVLWTTTLPSSTWNS